MLPEIGSREWIGVARSARCNAIFGRGGVVRKMTLTLDVPTYGTQPVTASSSLPTKPEEWDKTIDHEGMKRHHLSREELDQMLFRSPYP